MRVFSAAPAALAVAAMLAAGCGNVFGPKTYEEAMKEAAAANAAGDLKKVASLCERALELADKVGNGGRTIWALECHADARLRLNKSPSLSAYAKAIKYPKDLGNMIGRYRLRNDYGVTLWQGGKEGEAITVLTEALNVYKGTARGGWDTHWERLHIIRNLAKMHVKKGPSADATAFATEWADDIDLQIGRSGNQYSSRPGAGPALELLADIISTGNPARAAELRTLAADEKEGYAQYLATSGTPPRCHNVGVMGTRLQRCFLELP